MKVMQLEQQLQRVLTGNASATGSLASWIRKIRILNRHGSCWTMMHAASLLT